MQASFLSLLSALLFTISLQAAGWQQNSPPKDAGGEARTAAPAASSSSDNKPREKVKASPVAGQTSMREAVAENAQPGSSGGSSPAIKAAIPSPANEELRGRIQDTLRNEPSLAGSRLDVTVTDSQIELSGNVPTAREKETARRIAQSYGNNRRVVDSKVNVKSGGAQSPQRRQGAR